MSERVIYSTNLPNIVIREMDAQLREACGEDYLGLGWNASEAEGEQGKLEVYLTSKTLFPIVEQVIANHDPAAIEEAVQESQQSLLDAYNALDPHQQQLAEDWSALTTEEAVARLQGILLDVVVLLKATIPSSGLQRS